MNNIEAIQYRSTVGTRMASSRWKEVRLTFLYAILKSLRLVGIRA